MKVALRLKKGFEGVLATRGTSRWIKSLLRPFAAVDGVLFFIKANKKIYF